jgi:CheY-like chemotaxis protein
MGITQIISKPILKLSALAKRISCEKNYSLRADRRSGSEIGALTDSFNQMLQEIEIRDGQLRRHESELEKEAAARTAELLALNTEVTASKERAEGGREDRTILVIDDDAVARDMMTRFLTREGFGVVSSGRGREILSLARQWQPIAITLDVLMGETSGWDILAELKADPDLADIPVIMVSIIDDKNRGFALGADDYLTKPVHPDRLMKVLQRYRTLDEAGSVLIIEDDEPSRQLLHRILERDGWKIEEAKNACEGLEKVAISVPSLILLDLMTPEMDGFEFVDRLRSQARYRSIPVVVLTPMELTDQERARLSEHVTRIASKASVSWASLMSELTSIVKNTVSNQPFQKPGSEHPETPVYSYAVMNQAGENHAANTAGRR